MEYIEICLFGQIIVQPLSNFVRWKFWKYKQL